MSFKRQQTPTQGQRFFFDGEMRVHKKVLERLGDDLSGLIQIVQDVRKRAADEGGLAEAEQFYEDAKSGIGILVIDKISRETLENPEVQKLFKNRNHYFMVKLYA